MATAAFVNAYNRSDPLNEKAPLASMEDLSVVDTPMDTPGASPRSQRARWSLHRSSIGSQLDPLIEEVPSGPGIPPESDAVLAGNSNLREFVDVEEELKQPMMTSTPLKSEQPPPVKHLFQKRSQAEKRFGSPSRLQMNLMKKNLAHMEQRQQQQQPQQYQQQPQQGQLSMFPHSCSDVPQQRLLRNPTHLYPPHRFDPYYDPQSPPAVVVRTCDTIQECPEPSPDPSQSQSQSEVRVRSEASSSSSKPRKKRRSWRKSDLNSVSEEDEGVGGAGGSAGGGEIEFSFTRILEHEKESAALIRSGKIAF